MVKKIVLILVILMLFFYALQTIVMATDNTQKETKYNIKYKTHVQYDGWQTEKADGKLAGTEGQAKRLEAIQIRLENVPTNTIVEYQVHVQNIGWQAWKKNGETAGTVGQALRIEAIEIKIVKDINDLTINELNKAKNPQRTTYRINGTDYTFNEVKTYLSFKEGTIFEKETMLEEISKIDPNLIVEQISDNEYVVKNQETGKWERPHK